MPTIGQRMFKLKELLAIRVGPGAAVLPKDVKRITMRMAPKIDDGHRGPKRFFKYILPRLKYRNPAVPITVDRKAAQTDPAVMTIIFGEAGTTATTSTSNAAATSAPSGASSNDRVVTIQMKHKSESEILQQLYDATGAQELEPTELEREELRELEERKERSKKDSERMIEVNRQRKREAQMLAAARGEIGVNPA
ncbi:putative 50s ribosomal protein mrp49 protein [Neofusicoccum parvum UCRNP2]|uniref:Ribosomal protein/NADH dehydrogenase domain-containing protein n=2 Tax=Neofusicoccum TaxID=407951 RepID=A0ABR3T7T6_9PEZI|nr:putative 50s ribosomal protein mrp49 protein [Neofusicoccum parvum UCRNP2]